MYPCMHLSASGVCDNSLLLHTFTLNNDDSSVLNNDERRLAQLWLFGDFGALIVIAYVVL